MTFYRSHGTYCAETTLKSALSLKGIDKKISELITRTNHEKGKGLWPVELLCAISSLGICPDYYVKEDFFLFNDETSLKNKILNYYGEENGQRISLESNLGNIVRSREEILSKIILRVYNPIPSEIEAGLKEGQIAISLINSDRYFRRQDKSHGHYILITGQDNSNFYYYDCGPKSFQRDGKMKKERLAELSENICLMDYGLILF